MKPDIDISVENEELLCKSFCKSCCNGCLEVAKWLLSVKPDINISSRDDFAFRWACHFRHLEVAKWLQSLKPYLYVIEYSKKGNYANYRIRTKKEANWERRKYALHMASQEKSNLLYHLPVDIAKSVIQFV